MGPRRSSPPMHHPNSPIPDVVAHRGLRARHPENTLAAIRGAIDCGARFIEVDVHLTADRVPVLLHDETLDRLCGVRGLVHRHTWSQLRRLRVGEAARFGAGSPEEPMATLGECVALIAAHPGVTLFVELKESAERVFGTEEVVSRVLARLAPIEERCVLISFSESLLREVQRRVAWATGPVIRRWRQRGIVDRLGRRPEYLFADLRGLPQNGPLRVDGIQTVIYEVGDATTARALGERGIALVESFNACGLIRALGDGNAGRTA